MRWPIQPNPRRDRKGMPINRAFIRTAFIREVGLFRWVGRTAIRQFYKRIARRDHAMQLPTGEWMTLPIADHFASEVFITGGDVDWGSERLLFSLLEGKGAFLDVGAHIGYYSLYVLPRVRVVYAFEPDPRVRALLEKNVSGRRNVEVISCAVGDAQGCAQFTLERDSEISHLSEEGEADRDQIVVDVITIDAFVAEHGLTVEAIKIDVEGHDTEVIEGALGLLQEQQPIVLTEARPDALLFNLTRRVSYRVFAYVRHPRTRSKRFAEMFQNLPIAGESKMHFLVPERLAERFMQLAGVAPL
jgi:FkbM family methyltransferase